MRHDRLYFVIHGLDAASSSHAYISVSEPVSFYYLRRVVATPPLEIGDNRQCGES